MPRSASPQAKADSAIASKPPVKAPPKGITPITPVAMAKPPPKALTTDAAEREARAKSGSGGESGKAESRERSKGACRLEEGAGNSGGAPGRCCGRPHLHLQSSPPTGPRSPLARSFLKKTSDAFRLDPKQCRRIQSPRLLLLLLQQQLGCVSPPVVLIADVEIGFQAKSPLDMLDMCPLSSGTSRGM